MTNNLITSPVFDALWDAPMSDRGFLRVNGPRSTVTLQGLDCGKTTALSIRTDEVLGGHVVVLHTEGSSYWVGRTMARSYAGAEVQTVLVEREPRSIGGGEAS